MIDKKHIGKVLPSFSVTADAGQLRFFAKTIGETNPLYFDEQAARDAGHPALPLPPTFLFSLAFQAPSQAWRDELGIISSRILHGEESFTYQRLAYAGDTLHYDVRIVDERDVNVREFDSWSMTARFCAAPPGVLEQLDLERALALLRDAASALLK